MFTSKVTRRCEIPHEPGQYMDLRLLSWTQLQEARDARQGQVLKSVREVGAILIRELQAARETLGRPDEDPGDQYDRATLLRRGIVAWSYDLPVSPEAIADLDEPTAEWAARVLLDLVHQSDGTRLKGC